MPNRPSNPPTGTVSAARDARITTLWIEHPKGTDWFWCECRRALSFGDGVYSTAITNAFIADGHSEKPVTIPPRISIVCPHCFIGHFRDANAEYPEAPVRAKKSRPPMPLNFGGFPMKERDEPWTIFELRAFFFGLSIGILCTSVAFGLAHLFHWIR